ncbi:MAG: SRPBCC family protein [Burkholderiaceae bacterium]|nr:SRPBCC family protein [Burkholderiaceae bacterium]
MKPLAPASRPRRLILLSLLLPLAGAVQAHGPTRQKVVEQIVIDAPAAAVWARIRNFDALKDWHPAVAESPADKGNAEGSVRQLKLRGGGALTETLENHDDARMKYSYRAKDGGALPVTNYTSTISVRADGDARCSVEWRGAFYRGYPNNDPPPDQNDEAAVKAITGVYTSGLANLKKLAEAR